MLSVLCPSGAASSPSVLRAGAILTEMHLHKKPKSRNNASPHSNPVMTPTGTRDLILDAAERLIGFLGYSKTTMDDVAKAAGVGKRTIYVYFPSKEEVILCTIDRIVDRLV